MAIQQLNRERLVRKMLLILGDGFGKEVDEEEQGRLGNIIDRGLLL